MTGFLILDKAKGDTSAYAVNVVKRLLKPIAGKTACGHLGTLDPLASGVLPIAVGNATRLFDYFLAKRKTYRARFRFGATTETLDEEGRVTIGGPIPSEEEILRALPAFLGEIEQLPPRFSARCLDGKRGYELARDGKEFDLPAKKVTIYRFDLLRRTAPDEFEFEICCSGGTYIRSLSRDLALACKTQGYTTFLRRTRCGCFTESHAVPLSELNSDNLKFHLIPTDMVLPFPVLEVSDPRYYSGVRYPVEQEDGRYTIARNGLFYGTGIVEDGVLRPDKKLC